MTSILEVGTQEQVEIGFMCSETESDSGEY